MNTVQPGKCSVQAKYYGVKNKVAEIADFLGHRNTKSVGIYAKCDIADLRKVAAFRLGGLR